ncbi:hypothetical protein AMELA_G00138220 [Ameiurus melas]|uniref:Uncharacterized protein n=1 Tax=Ameiurus melas TaxID=219545 RepID=A0A7J6AKD1_AMEME|nr:hypothetical protein AMELA_G00138220 [Ameiurus melas]
MEDKAANVTEYSNVTATSLLGHLNCVDLMEQINLDPCFFSLTGPWCLTFYLHLVNISYRTWEIWSLSQGASGTRQGTPWTGCQSIPGHNHIHTRIHTLWTLWTCQSAYHACLWPGGGSRSTRRKPPKQGENIQTLHTQGSGWNPTHSPGSARQTC